MDRVVQAAYVGGLQGVGQPVGAQPRSVQDLVAVDVADPGDHMLVEQQRLQLPCPGAEDAGELGNGQSIGDRVDPERGEFGQLDLDMMQDRRPPSRRTCADRRTTAPAPVRRRGAGRHECDRVEGSRPSLTSTRPLIRRWIIRVSPVSSEHMMYLPRRPIDVMVAPVRPSTSASTGRAANRSFPTDLDAVDTTTDDERDHSSPNGLDLRQLRHGGYPSCGEHVVGLGRGLLLGELLRLALAGAAAPCRSTSTVALNILE